MKLKTTVGPKGQVVIPKPIRERLGIKPSDTVLLEVEGDRMILSPAPRNPIQTFVKIATKFGGKASELKWGDRLYEEVMGGAYGLSRLQTCSCSRPLKPVNWATQPDTS